MSVLMVLYFGFVTKTVLITHWCFIYCWAEAFLFHAALPARRLVCTKMGRIMLIGKMWGEEGGTCSLLGCWSSQVTIMCDEAQLPWKWPYICPLMESKEWITYFTLLVHASLLCRVGCLYHNLQVFTLLLF